MTATPTPLRELLTEWRESARETIYSSDERNVYAECADELDAALSARDEAGAVRTLRFWTESEQDDWEALRDSVADELAHLGAVNCLPDRFDEDEWPQIERALVAVGKFYRDKYATPPASGEAGARFLMAEGEVYPESAVEPEIRHEFTPCDANGIATPPASGEAALNGARPLPADRDTLGRFVREAWVRWAQQQPNPKPSWLVPYSELSEADKEADRQIGEAVARWTLILDASRLAAVVPAGMDGWQPIETAPKDNKRLLYLARFNPDTGELVELDFDGIWQAESESWELPQVYYFWASNRGIEEPTHWAYQDEAIPFTPPATAGQE